MAGAPDLAGYRGEAGPASVREFVGVGAGPAGEVVRLDRSDEIRGGELIRGGGPVVVSQNLVGAVPEYPPNEAFVAGSVGADEPLGEACAPRHPDEHRAARASRRLEGAPTRRQRPLGPAPDGGPGTDDPHTFGQCEIASGPLLRGTAEICIPRNLFASRVHPVAVDLVALFDDLVRLETDLWNRVDARVQQTHGFPLAWMEVMHLVSTTSGRRVLDVAEALFITVGGASKVVDKVEGAGWCRRLPNPNDGRSNLLELTASGRRVLQAGRLTFGEVLEVYLGAAAPAAELTQLSSTLGRMRRHLIVADQVAGPVRW